MFPRWVSGFKWEVETYIANDIPFETSFFSSNPCCNKLILFGLKFSVTMRFATFVTTFISLITFINCQLVDPTFVKYEHDLVERDFNVSDILDGFDIADFISDLDADKIAGWANNLLNAGGEDILESLLTGLKNTNLLPEAVVYLVTHNWTLNILEDALPILLDVASKVNTTTVFVALDRSGIVYSIIRGALEDEQFFPSVWEIVKKTASGLDIDFSNIVEDAINLVTREEDQFDNGIEKFAMIERRDNVEDLLTNILTAVSDSGLLPATINTLVADPQFQDAAALLLQGGLQNIGSAISGTNFTALRPVISSLWDSGLLQHTIERALSDGDLLSLVIKDIGAIFTNDKKKRDEFMGDSMSSSVSVTLMSSTMETVAVETNSTSAPDVPHQSEDFAFASNVNKWSLGLGVMAPVLLM